MEYDRMEKYQEPPQQPPKKKKRRWGCILGCSFIILLPFLFCCLSCILTAVFPVETCSIVVTAFEDSIMQGIEEDIEKRDLTEKEKEEAKEVLKKLLEALREERFSKEELIELNQRCQTRRSGYGETSDEEFLVIVAEIKEALRGVGYDIPKGEIELDKLEEKREKKIEKAKVYMKKIMVALEIYQAEQGEYPNKLDALTKKKRPKSSERYIEKIKKDPWGNDYVYNKPGKNGRDYDLICYGSDGMKGGLGLAKDIYSYELK